MSNTPMTVGELIDKLKVLNPDFLVYGQTSWGDSNYLSLSSVVQKAIGVNGYEVPIYKADSELGDIVCVCLDFM